MEKLMKDLLEYFRTREVALGIKRFAWISGGGILVEFVYPLPVPRRISQWSKVICESLRSHVRREEDITINNGAFIINAIYLNQRIRVSYDLGDQYSRIRANLI